MFTKKLKIIATWILFFLAILFFVFLFVFKDKLVDYTSKNVKQQEGSKEMNAEAAYVDSAFNYAKNKQSYQVTFLEFGATGCAPCKRMEEVMKEVRFKYSMKVKVLFLNVVKPENHDLMKHFGIAAIPTQVLLDDKGVEYFRHTGFIEFTELERNFKLK